MAEAQIVDRALRQDVIDHQQPLSKIAIPVADLAEPLRREQVRKAAWLETRWRRRLRRWERQPLSMRRLHPDRERRAHESLVGELWQPTIDPEVEGYLLFVERSD
jgi:hypothetical protein